MVFTFGDNAQVQFGTDDLTPFITGGSVTFDLDPADAPVHAEHLRSLTGAEISVTLSWSWPPGRRAKKAAKQETFTAFGGKPGWPSPARPQPVPSGRHYRRRYKGRQGRR